MNPNLISRFWNVKSPWRAGASPETADAPAGQPCLRHFTEGDWTLCPGEIQVWCLNLDTVRPGETVGLSEDEIVRGNRFRQRLDRQRFMACRGLLREMLGRYTGRRPEDLVFHYGPNGKPELESARPDGEPPIYFNVSHSGELALFGFSLDAEVGVDIERVRPLGDMEEMACMVFSHAEWKFWQGLPVELKPAAFFDCWTKKEAILKTSGTGLSASLKSVTVLGQAGDLADITEIDLLTSFWAHDGCRAAVAARQLKAPETLPGRSPENHMTVHIT